MLSSAVDDIVPVVVKSLCVVVAIVDASVVVAMPGVTETVPKLVVCCPTAVGEIVVVAALVVVATPDEVTIFVDVSSVVVAVASVVPAPVVLSDTAVVPIFEIVSIAAVVILVPTVAPEKEVEVAADFVDSDDDFVLVVDSPPTVDSVIV